MEESEELGPFPVRKGLDKLIFFCSENCPNSDMKASIMMFPGTLLILYILKAAPSFMASFSRQRIKGI